MITLQSVTKTYLINKNNRITPISDFSLQIERGETVILSGASGSGKSTLLSIMAGLTKPTSGSVTVKGKLLSKLPEQFSSVFRREHFGFIFQKFHLIEKMSVRDNISVPLLPSGLTGREIALEAEKVMGELGLSDKADVDVELLSGGEMQRVAIGRALAGKPEIILADEPTANLDSSLTESLLQILTGEKNKGKTIVVSTHDKTLIESGIADRIINVEKAD